MGEKGDGEAGKFITPPWGEKSPTLFILRSKKGRREKKRRKERKEEKKKKEKKKGKSVIPRRG